MVEQQLKNLQHKRLEEKAEFEQVKVALEQAHEQITTLGNSLSSYWRLAYCFIYF